jgi:hypothetical protein
MVLFSVTKKLGFFELLKALSNKNWALQKSSNLSKILIQIFTFLVEVFAISD